MYLELSYSKKEILAMYLSNAPFGGNVVGLDAASWRFYNRSADELSWAEAATLAVLPNAPSLIFPGMLVTFMYLDKDNIKTLKGVILKAHHYTKLRGQGITQNQYQTLSSLYVFITRPRE